MRDAQRQIEQAAQSGRHELDLYGCRLTEVPESVRTLTSLVSLRLARNKLTELPEWLGELTRLVRLDVSDNKITELPSSIGDLTQLGFLELHMNKLSSLPDTMRRLRRLTWLNLNGNKLTTVPEVLLGHTGLVRLNLSANKLTTVPDELAGLTELVRLDLGYNKLTELSPRIGDLTELRFLMLNNNRLTSLPDTIGNLGELIELELQENLLTELPASMARLHSLTFLSLFHNRISSPPHMLADLPRLTVLSLLGNPLPEAEELTRGVQRYSPPEPGPPRSEMFYRFWAGVTAPITFERDVIDAIPNIGALRLLDGEERIEAEDMLIAKLAENDGRVPNALADVGCVRAIPALIEATTTKASPYMRVCAARALLALGDQSGRGALVQMLRTHDGGATARGSAAELLAEFPDPDKELLLTTASTDPSSSVRSAAFDAVLALWRLDDQKTKWGEVLMNIGGFLVSSLACLRNEAMTELRGILARLDDGHTPEQLGLTWRINKDRKPWRRFFNSFDRDGLNYPLHGLTELTGPERTVLENVILIRLDKDRRAVRAAATLTVHRAIEPLREMLDSATGHARTEIESVLDTLTH